MLSLKNLQCLILLQVFYLNLAIQFVKYLNVLDFFCNISKIIFNKSLNEIKKYSKLQKLPAICHLVGSLFFIKILFFLIKKNLRKFYLTI